MACNDCLKHTIKLKNKPINTGYKVWCIEDHSYIWSWLFYSRIEGIKTFIKSQLTHWLCADNLLKKSTLLASTFALILCLVSQLSKELKFCIYLDNLFMNVPVTQCLLAMNIYCMDTTRKKATDVSLSLQSYLNDNSELLWNSMIAEVINSNVLCFIWQDNKSVCAITTAHSLHWLKDQI